MHRALMRPPNSRSSATMPLALDRRNRWIGLPLSSPKTLLSTRCMTTSRVRMFGTRKGLVRQPERRLCFSSCKFCVNGRRPGVWPQRKGLARGIERRQGFWSGSDMRSGRISGGGMVCDFKMKYSKLKLSKMIGVKSGLPATRFKVTRCGFFAYKRNFFIKKQYDFRTR